MTGLLVVALALIATALAASPAWAFTQTLKVTSKMFWQGDTGANNVAVDHQGAMFALVPKNFFSLNSTLASKVFELTPKAKKLGQITGKVPRGPHTHVAGQVAVTPNGRIVVLAGNDTANGEVGSFTPFVGEYSASTRKFIRGTNFDTVGADRAGAAAVDSTGHDLYVADHIKKASNRIFEFRIGDLHRERVFTLHGDAASLDSNVDALAAGGPDDDLYVALDRFQRPNSDRTFIQVYTSTGRFLRELSSGDYFGVAVNAAGQIYSGSSHGLRMWDDRGHFHGTRIHTSKTIIAEGFDASDHLFAYQFRRIGGSILKFRPRTTQTEITLHPAKVSTRPALDFGIVSTRDPDATFQCRLDRAGFDRGPFTSCGETPHYANVANGSYKFEARAVSIDGSIDATPASYSFKQAVAYAHARITSHPPAVIGQTSVAFGFTSSAHGATFRCQLVLYGNPQGPFTACKSPANYHNLRDGLHNFEVEAVTSDGYAEPAPAEYQFAVDSAPPVVTAPAASLPSGQQLGQTGDTAIGLSWSASDPNTSSANLLDSLQGRSGPSAGALGTYATVPGAGGTGNPSASVTLTPGSTRYQFLAQAQNALGIVGTSPDSDVLGLGLTDNGDAAVTYSGGWSAVSDASAVDGTVQASGAKGATASLIFTGSSVGVIGVLGSPYGSMQICIDPTTDVTHCSTVSESSSATTQRELIFTRNGLSNAQHTIQITATTATPILLDGFVALN